MGRESRNPGTVSDGTRAVHDRGVPAVLGRIVLRIKLNVGVEIRLKQPWAGSV
jgi:hypothetical protein